ncbi:MAG: hypothetical protein KTR13_03975 [Saprospiraceae bacterium]|nr:hypothetical protein [Saprospiraceae bacterium]
MKKNLTLFALGLFGLYACQDETTVDPVQFEEPLTFTVSEDESNSVLLEKPIFSQTGTTDTITYCGETSSYDMLGAGRYDTGQFTLANDEEFLYITMTAENNWRFWWAKVYVGDCVAMPIDSHGNPIVGDFNLDPYDATSAYNTEIKFKVPIADISDETCIAAYAPMYKQYYGYLYFVNSWAHGEYEFEGNRTDFFTRYKVGVCEQVEEEINECGNLNVLSSFVSTVEFEEINSFEGNVNYILTDLAGDTQFTSGVAAFGRGVASVDIDVQLPAADTYRFVFSFPDGDCAEDVFIDQFIDG